MVSLVCSGCTVDLTRENVFLRIGGGGVFVLHKVQKNHVILHFFYSTRGEYIGVNNRFFDVCPGQWGYIKTDGIISE